MKDMIKVTLSLVVIFIAAGLIMGLTYMKTSPVRFVAEKKEHEEALKLMAPEATDPIHTAGTWTIHGKPSRYYDATSGGKTVAYIADTSGKGQEYDHGHAQQRCCCVCGSCTPPA